MPTRRGFPSMKAMTKLSAKPKERSEPRDCMTHTRYTVGANIAADVSRKKPRVFKRNTNATIAGMAASRDIPEARTMGIPATVGIRTVTP